MNKYKFENEFFGYGLPQTYMFKSQNLAEHQNTYFFFRIIDEEIYLFAPDFRGEMSELARFGELSNLSDTDFMLSSARMYSESWRGYQEYFDEAKKLIIDSLVNRVKLN